LTEVALSFSCACFAPATASSSMSYEWVYAVTPPGYFTLCSGFGSRYSYPMPIGDERPARLRNLPEALSIAVTCIGAQMRCTSWSM
jgi:hypothetical protein